MTELSRKADMALADLTANGGLLLPEQNDTFIRKLIDAPTFLRAVRSHPMNAPEERINKIGFGGRILRAASQTGGQEDNGTNGRYLAKADRSAPTTSQISMATKEIIAEIRLPYEVFEDNIEGDGLKDTILHDRRARCSRPGRTDPSRRHDLRRRLHGAAQRHPEACDLARRQCRR